MKFLVFLLPLLMVGTGLVYAEPLGELQTSVLDSTNDSATVQITWNQDDTVSSYEIGCVSCFPNTEESTSGTSITLSGITTFPNSSIAMLYGLAYDLEGNLIAAKQIFVNLES